MKKVEKVSIAEISFTLDNDAYLALKHYLDSLHAYYDDDPDGREIIADIEARIAELILEEQVYTKVVSKTLVDTIIAQLGTPDQIDDAAGDGLHAGDDGSLGAGSGGGYSVGGSSVDSSIPRRLHRSSEGKIVGGVCSGIARYLDISVVWVRLTFLLPVILQFVTLPFSWGFNDFHRHWNMYDFLEGWTWVFLVTYIVLWIALPMARTPRQRLEARGERITPASIRHNMQETASTPAGKKAASVAAELVTVLGRVVLFIVKFVTAVVGFSLLFTAVIVFIAMASILFNPASVSLIEGETIITVLEGIKVLSPLMFAELILLCIMLPLVVLGMALLSFTFTWKLGRVFYTVTLGIWGAAMILAGIVSASNVRFFHDELPYRIEQWDYHYHYDNGRWEMREHREWRWDRNDGWRNEHREWERPENDSLDIEQTGAKDSVTNRVRIRRVY
jgi:phage shock protein PspC (stress-responsive transcriptional regulator)